MRHRDAVGLLRAADLAALGPTTWADLGSGTGTFTLALAELLAPGSTIHAIDIDGAALDTMPRTHGQVRITRQVGDFTATDWPFGDSIDGVLMANSLHYVKDQASFVIACASRMASPRFLIVEYDTDTATPWVPYPVSRARVTTVFRAAGCMSIKWLGSRSSVFRRAMIYAALIACHRPSHAAEGSPDDRSIA